MNSLTKPILLIHLFLSVIVAIDVTCDRVNPLIQSDVTCVCKNAPGTDIDWLVDDEFNSNCGLSKECLPIYSGYNYSMNTTENVYMMTINSYDYSSCTKITCKDESDGSIKQSIIPSSLVFDTTFPTSMTEPGSNNSNGIISVTTGCISGFSDVQYDWYFIVDGLKERYSAHDTSIIDTIDNSVCVNCDTDVNGQRTIGFEHSEASEASGYETKTGRFKVYLYHISTDLQLTLTSRYYYTVKVNKPSESDGPANNKLRNGLIALGVVIGIIVIIVVIVIINLICVRPKLTNIKLEDTKMHLEWTDCLNCCFCCQRIFGYSIVRKPKQGQVTDITCKENVTKEKQCTLEKLDPMAIYEICLSRKFWSFRSFAQRRSVITRTLGMLNDQGNNAKPNSIVVWWTISDCITNLQMKYKVTCNEEVKEEKEENTNHIESTITGLMTGTAYKIEVFAIDNGTNSLKNTYHGQTNRAFEKQIETPAVQVCLEDVCYKPRQSCVECNITWTVKDFDIQEHLNESDNFYFIVKWCIEGQEVDKREKIRASRYTIPKLYPEHSYTVYVYPVYNSVTFEPAMIELTTPYKPTKLKPTAVKSTVIDVTWKKPDYTNGQRLQYQVICNEAEVEKTNQTSSKIKNLVPGQTYEIKIFTILKGINSLPSVTKIPTPSLKVSLKVVGYKPEESCVKCTIIWTVKDIDRPEPFNNPDDEFLYNVGLYSGNQLVHTSKEITDSSYTIPGIYTDRSYTVDVYAIYHLITLKPPGKIQLTPYKPTNLKYTAKSTQIELEWKRPQYTGYQPLTYEVTCNEGVCKTTHKTSCKLENLKPHRQYDIKIFTISNGMKSLPLQEQIRTIRPQSCQQVPLPEIQ